MNKKNKYGQEEIVGFVIIMIVVAIIFLFFLNFYLKSERKESIESYEANSFIQAFLHYTTECRNYFEYLPGQELIFECDDNTICLDDQEACDVLNATLEDILTESWLVGEDRPIKGYELKIMANDNEMLSFTDGNTTRNYKGAEGYRCSGTG